MPEYLFLYGTLLPGNPHSKSLPVLRRLKPVGSATVRGRLYDFGDYPGALVDPAAKTLIKGTLFKLPNNDEVLKALDEYEEFDSRNKKSSLFVRMQADATLDDGRRLPAWLYVYNRNPRKGRLIADGEYPESRAA
jgi:gamma-glutamylcyclotransferase (GGCT)/AIG2-like uncharacterized protein YtfP